MDERYLCMYISKAFLMNIFPHRSHLHIFCSKAVQAVTNVNYIFYIYFRPQTSDWKPQTLRESSYRQKKLETKPSGEMPPFDQLKTKMKETSRKLQVFSCFSSPSLEYFCASWRLSIGNFQQSILPFFKKTTRRTMARVRSLYVGLRAKRVLGFKCDLKKCDSTLMECSARACKKKSMIFGEPGHPCSSKTIDSSISDTSTISSTSEDRWF